MMAPLFLVIGSCILVMGLASSSKSVEMMFLFIIDESVCMA